MKRAQTPTTFAAIFALLAATPGCLVLKSDYDSVKAQHQAEQGAREEAHAAIKRLHEHVVQLERDLKRAERLSEVMGQTVEQQAAQLGKRDQTLAEVELQVALAEQRQQASEQLVSQLRSELSRVSDHLRAFAADKERLSGERQALLDQLEQAELRLGQLEAQEREAAFQAKAVRTIAVKLAGPLRAKTLGLDVTREYVELTTPSLPLLVKSSDRLTKVGKKHLRMIAKVLKEIDGSIELGERQTELKPPVVGKRLKSVAKALTDQGIKSERVLFAPIEQTKAKKNNTGAYVSLRLRALRPQIEGQSRPQRTDGASDSIATRSVVAP